MLLAALARLEGVRALDRWPSEENALRERLRTGDVSTRWAGQFLEWENSLFARRFRLVLTTSLAIGFLAITSGYLVWLVHVHLP